MSWLGFLDGSAIKNLPAIQETQETQVLSLGWEDPLEEGMATHSLLGEPHGQRSLAGYSPWGCKEMDMTKATEHSTTQLNLFAVQQKLIQYHKSTIL